MAKRKPKPKTSLYLNSASDYSIQDQHGKKYSVDEARQLHAAGLFDWNLSFQRLVELDFDIEAVKASYRKSV